MKTFGGERETRSRRWDSPGWEGVWSFGRMEQPAEGTRQEKMTGEPRTSRVR